MKKQNKVNGSHGAGVSLKGKIELSNIFYVILTVILFGVFIWWLLGVYKSQGEITGGDPYFDEDFNMTVMIPQGWHASKPDANGVKDVLMESTGGHRFDMMFFPIKEEIIPLAFTLPPKQDSSEPFSKFITLGFRGSDDEYTLLSDKLLIKDEFEVLLKELEHENIKVISVEDYESEDLLGVLLKAEAELEGNKIYYMQYLEPAGKNILTVTYGSTSKKESKISDIEFIVSNIIYHSTGIIPTIPLEDEEEDSSNIEPTETLDEVLEEGFQSFTEDLKKNQDGFVDDHSDHDHENEWVEVENNEETSNTQDEINDKESEETTEGGQNNGVIIKDADGNVVNKK